MAEMYPVQRVTLHNIDNNNSDTNTWSLYSCVNLELNQS